MRRRRVLGLPPPASLAIALVRVIGNLPGFGNVPGFARANYCTIEAADPSLRPRVVQAVREALLPYVADGLRMPCAAWMVTAHRP